MDAGLGKLAGKSVPVRISGNLNDPDVSADVSAIIASEVEGLILDKLGIGKKKEEEVPADSSGGQPDTGPAEQQAPQEEKQETTPEEDAVKALKKLLGG